MLTVCALVLVASHLEAAFPSPKGFVNDFAGVMDEATEAQVEATVRGVMAATSAEIVVVTVPSLGGQTVEQYAVDLFAAWGIGKAREDNGVLVLVSPTDRAMRIEVGYGLEPALTDGLAGEIIRQAFLPRFREGDYNRGILEGVRRVATVVRTGDIGESGTRDVADDETPPAWQLIPFFSIFVGGGAFGAGAAVRSKTRGLLLWGAIFGTGPLVIGTLLFPTISALTLVPLALAVFAVGYRKAASPEWRSALRGKAETDSTDWISGSSDSSTSESSGDSFSGGSSGGGGASGRW